MISLVMATYGRGPEARDCLASLVRQEFRDFEVVVVDQNPGPLFGAVLDEFRDQLPHVRYLRTDRPGISRARNLGLREASGSVVAFPDDDCQYPSDLLGRVWDYFHTHRDLDGLTGLAADFSGRPFRGYDRTAGWLNMDNLWYRSISITIFLRKALVDRVGEFDEDLGAGAKFGSAEETDYILRSVKAGGRIFFDPAFTVLHAEPLANDPRVLIPRGYTYGLGLGYILRKHRIGFWRSLKWFLRPLGGIAVRLVQGNPDHARYYYSVLRGRIKGWLSPR